MAVPVSEEEVGYENPAAGVAAAVDRILPRTTISSGEDGEEPGVPGLDDILKM